MIRDPRAGAALQLAAGRRFDLVSPDQVVDWAIEQLHVDPTPPELLALASLSHPVEGDAVDRLLSAFLANVGAPLIDEERAGLLLARGIAEKIVDGSVDPVHGARTIWWDVLRRVPALEDRLGEFAGLASEWEDTTEHRSEYGNAIVDAASRLIADSPEP